jgi:hypothetical protein
MQKRSLAIVPISPAAPPAPRVPAEILAPADRYLALLEIPDFWNGRAFTRREYAERPTWRGHAQRTLVHMAGDDRHAHAFVGSLESHPLAFSNGAERREHLAAAAAYEKTAADLARAWRPAVRIDA